MRIGRGVDSRAASVEHAGRCAAIVMATQRLPTIRSVQAAEAEADEPEAEAEPEPEPRAVLSYARKYSVQDDSMSIARSEQVQLRLGQSHGDQPSRANDRGGLREESVRLQGSDAQRATLRGARHDCHTQRKRHRPDDVLAFWCLEEFSYLGHEDWRQGDGDPPRRDLRHRLHRRDLLKVLNDNRSELLRHIKPVGAAKTAPATGQRSAAARAAAGANGATPRPGSTHVGFDLLPDDQPSAINRLRASGSEDGLSSLARGSGHVDLGIGAPSAAGAPGSSAQHVGGSRSQLAVGHRGGGRAQIRDLRLLDGAASQRSGVGKPAIWVRHSCILVSLEGFRCAIMRQRLLLFSVPAPPSGDSDGSGKTKGDTGRVRSTSERAVVEEIAERVRESARTPHTSSSSSGNNNLLTGNESLPWELRAFELFLEEAVWRLEDDFRVLEEKVKSAIALIRGTTPGGLGAMHRAKRALLLYVSRAQDMHVVLENLLEDPEDLAAMHLTDRRLFEVNLRTASPAESFQTWKAAGGGGSSLEDLEDMIEIYSDTANNLLQAGQQLQEEVKDTEELVSLQLDTQRNKILGVEVIITIVSSVFALGAFVVSNYYAFEINR